MAGRDLQRLFVAWMVVLLVFGLHSAKGYSFYECDKKSKTALEYVRRICDCNTPSKNCNPLCPFSYIHCGRTDGRKNATDMVVNCRHGSIYDSVRQDCVRIKWVKYPCKVATPAQQANPAAACLTADCFCLDQPSGQYPNPFDAFCQSYIICNNNGKFLGNVEKVQLCGNGQRYNPVKKACDAAANVPCGDAPLDSCSDPVCFCTNRAPGLYDNPLDFEGNSAIECGTCGTFLSIFFGVAGAFFDGKDFVLPTPANPKAQLCGQASGGIKGSSDSIFKSISAGQASTGRRLASLPFMDLNPSTSAALELFNSSSSSTSLGGCGRSILLVTPRNSVQLLPATACNPALKCPTRTGSAYVRLGCYLVQCVNGCATLASTRSLCTAAPPRRRPPPPRAGRRL